eukprot:4600341-Prymnesium_polylepis.1
MAAASLAAGWAGGGAQVWKGGEGACDGRHGAVRSGATTVTSPRACHVPATCLPRACGGETTARGSVSYTHLTLPTICSV